MVPWLGFVSFMQQKGGAALLTADGFLSRGCSAAGCLSLCMLLADAEAGFFTAQG